MKSNERHFNELGLDKRYILVKKVDTYQTTSIQKVDKNNPPQNAEILD